MAAALDRVVASVGFGRAELATLMATLFSDASAAFAESQQTTPVHRVDAAELEEQAPTLETAPRAAARASDDGDATLSPIAVTLDALRRPPLRRRLRARAWRLLLAAVIAAVLGGLTGWQISHAHAAMHAIYALRGS
jgi:hypothetical protein